MRFGVCDGRCPAALAKDDELKRLRTQNDTLTKQLAEIAGVRATLLPPRPAPAPVPRGTQQPRITPWAHSLMADGHASKPPRHNVAPDAVGPTPGTSES